MITRCCFAITLTASFLLISCTPFTPAAIQDAQIKGKVEDQRGRPVDHISIQVFDQQGKLTRGAFTEADGQYVVSRLKEGSVYDVAVASISQQLARQRNVKAGSAGINFRVPLVTLRGTVHTADGKEAKSARVSAESVDWALQRETNTLKDGSFEIDQLPPAIFEVTARADEGREKVVKVDLAKMKDSVRIKLDSPATIEIQVLEQTSQKPIAQADVSLGEQVAGNLRYRYIGQTDENGNIVDPAALPGRTLIMVASPLHQQEPQPVELTAGKSLKTTVFVDRSASIVGDLSSVIKGRLKRIAIMAEPEQLLPKGDVGTYIGRYRNGKFTIDVPPGQYTAHAIIDLDQPSDSISSPSRSLVLQSKQITVKRGERKQVELHAANK